MLSLGDEVLSIDEHKLASGQYDSPPAGRIDDTFAADINCLSGYFPEILDNDATGFGVGVGVHPNPHIHRHTAIVWR